MTIINTNARSLTPKIDSLIECFSELDVDIGIVTETWLKSGVELDLDLRDLEDGTGIAGFCLNRDPNPRTGVAHGGVAVFYKKSLGNMKVVDINNPEKFEILTVAGSIRGSARKIGIIAVYLPPNYSTGRANRAIEHVENIIIELRRKYTDPYLVLAGDFNQWPVEQALAEFGDMREVEVGPTRGTRSIDRVFCNMFRMILSSGTVPALETEADSPELAAVSDHRIAHFTAKLPVRQRQE